jgi:hypothetical protein
MLAMKRFLLLALVSSAMAYGQTGITITEADFAHGGDTVRMSQAFDSGYDVSITGPNATWDFSSLTATTQSLKNFRPLTGAPGFISFLFGSLAPAKYQANYYIENTTLPIDQVTSFLPVQITDIFGFTRFTTANDSVQTLGVAMTVDFGSGPTSIPFRSDTIETRYLLPLAYNDAYSSRGYTNIDFNPVYNARWVQARQRTSLVDGFGTLTTPLGSFDVIRIKHDITEQDEITLEVPIFGEQTIPLDLPIVHEYEWWANGQGEPVLKIVSNEIAGNEVITSIEYRDLYLGLDAGIQEETMSFELYPNPSTDVLNIISAEAMDQLNIMDLSGKRVRTEKMLGQGTAFLKIDALESGTYLIEVISDAGVSTRTFIKQ